MNKMKEFTQQEAIDFYESNVWKNWSLEEIALFQLHQPKLCVPFVMFHESVEALLDRSVWTHELDNPENLLAEYKGRVGIPTMNDIIIKLFKLMDK
jgi:hypothetical protein